MTLTLHYRFGLMTACLLLMAVNACASEAPESSTADAPPAGTVAVPAALETKAVATANADAADDPAIWAAAAGTTAILGGETVQGFIAGTDKKAGLYFYGLDGRELQFLPEGLLNNVDLREDVSVAGRKQVVIGASDRGRMGVALYLYDPSSTDPANQVRRWGFIRSDLDEPYGFCLGKSGAELHAILIGKDGQARQYRIDSTGGEPRGIEVRRFAIGSQSEGCVVDDGSARLYIGEEAKGLWSYSFAPDGGDQRKLVQGVDGSGRLVADVEGVALMRDADRTFVLVSSQGDSAFAVWQVNGKAPIYRGRFKVGAGVDADAVSGTDGIDARGGMVGTFPEGIIVVQDDENDGQAQNFKLVDWREIRRALGL
ncbi:phytase [Sphingosinicella rhizophila]|uniref:Phytase n=1 Tax=Sphingosinicella rhizophila TaxID=3050082 RepID=A0ABU3Q2P3_9SPHN|nr:phytase [Sphingosinicella sp. GR2756]MDT9597671.1 phytase [Sphingosinicella sp. GR2756]